MARVAPVDWAPKGIDELEPAASEAVRFGSSACVVAGPGAGKTEFLAQRADYLLSTGECRSPRNILAISFKRDAARNLAQRVEKRSPEGSSRFHSMTFDAFTKGIVDRFRASLPEYWRLRGAYEIGYSSERDASVFLDELAATDDGWGQELHAIPRNTFLTAILGDYRLPAEPSGISSPEEFAVLTWWKRTYLERDPQRLDFVLLNRLAELIIRSTPQVRRALRMTYPFVFVDEFQDTTYAQYSFLRSVFGGSTTLTAVGDNKQRIMGWAGALDDAFHEFRADFGAALFELEWNFRSSDELIEVQHVVARNLDPSVKRAVSMVGSSIDGDAAEIWCFQSIQDEARHIAEWIHDDATTSGRSAAEYALLARQKSADFEPLFSREMARVGLRLRNDDSEVGSQRLQDLLADPVATLVLDVLKLGSSNGGNPHTWIATSERIVQLHGLNHLRDDGQDGDRHLSTFLKELRSWMRSNPPGRHAAHEATEKVVEFIGTDAIRRVLTSHRTADAVDIVVEAIKARMDQVADSEASWRQVCEEFEGCDAVALMTVHKSKGLEYHTVFFLGIDDRQWWSLKREQKAATATFFVGLSRAEQRTIFTYCAERGDREAVEELYTLLDAAGVSERHF